MPVVRAAVQDRSFFVRDQHPARELLNSVAESGATWLADDDADPQLVTRLEQAVDRVVEEYDGDESVFERANREVQEHYRAQARKAEVSERRQVEAARGRDRLETAKRKAAETIAARLGGRKPPQFVQGQKGKALLYIEVDNYQSEKTASGKYRTLLSLRLSLLDKNGKELWSQPPTDNIEDVSRERRRDFFLTYGPLTIPKDLGPGTYVLKVEVEDVLAQKTNSGTAEFKIVQR